MKKKNVYEVRYFDVLTLKNRLKANSTKSTEICSTLKDTMDFLMALGIICLNKNVDPYETGAEITIEGKPCLPVDWERAPEWTSYHPVFCWTEPVGDKTVTHWKTYTKITKKELLS